MAALSSRESLGKGSGGDERGRVLGRTSPMNREGDEGLEWAGLPLWAKAQVAGFFSLFILFCFSFQLFCFLFLLKPKIIL